MKKPNQQEIKRNLIIAFSVFLALVIIFFALGVLPLNGTSIIILSILLIFMVISVILGFMFRKGMFKHRDKFSWFMLVLGLLMMIFSMASLIIGDYGFTNIINFFVGILFFGYYLFKIRN